MKHRFSISLATAGILSMLAFSNCSKNVQQDPAASNLQNDGRSTSATQAALAPGDRIDAIVKGLSVDSYSLSFDKATPSSGITRTAYGADNYLVFADPQDLICPEPLRILLKRVPIWKRPLFPVPTCPDMIYDLSKLKQILEVARNADPLQFRAVNQVKLANGGGLLATEKFYSKYSSLQGDRVDVLTKELSPEKFIILGSPDFRNGGVFTRDFYGYADLNSILFKPYKLNLKDILKPTLKGCFDPEILKLIREKLVATNPALYKNLAVTPFAQDKNIAFLSF